MRFKWPLKLYRVSGASMLPTFQPGDLLVGWRWFRPQAGQVVIAQTDRPFLKRIKWLTEAGAWIEGDNQAASTDSRSFGTVPSAALEAKIIARLPAS